MSQPEFEPVSVGEFLDANGKVDRAAARAAKRRLTSQSAAEVRAVRTRWLWKHYLPLGAVSVLAGRQGLGKSTLAIDLAARVTRGKLPGDLKGRARSVLFLTAEDSVGATLRPRLEAAGGDLHRVHFVDARQSGVPSPVELPGDAEALADMADELDAAFVVVDPLMAFLTGPGRNDSHRDQDVRAALHPLFRVAEESSFCLLAVMHLNKTSASADALLRVSGSVAFTAAPRSVLIFASDPTDPDGEAPVRVLAQAKNNLGPKQPSRVCHIETVDVETTDGPSEQPRMRIRGASPHTASDVVGAAGADTDERSARAEAGAFLRAALRDGPIRAKLIPKLAKDAGVDASMKTLHRAKKDVGVESREIRDGSEHYWVWELPARGGD